LGTVVNPALSFLRGGSPEMLLTKKNSFFIKNVIYSQRN